MASSRLSTGFQEPFLDATLQLRLLKIHPAAFDAPIKCGLENVLRDAKPIYSALSYTYGSKANGRLIHINDREVRITVNCESALRHIRREDEPVTIWIDAICIDQSDKDEKSAQIAQMHNIYKSAAHVIVWLGNERADTSVAFDLFNQISQLGRYDPAVATSRSIGSPSAWQAVEDLFKREYFQRIWIVQEVSLAKEITIRCGSYILPWPIFNRALEWYVKDVEHVKRNVTNKESLYMNAAQVRNQWAFTNYSSGSRPSLEYLLSVFSHWRATDLLDKVNALLGMSKEHAVHDLQPDYNKSVPEVYASVVKFLIKRDRRLSILGQCQNPAEYKGLPTWVPDWTPGAEYRHQISEPYRPKGDAQVMTTSRGHIMIPASYYVPESSYGSWAQESTVREEMNFSASLEQPAEYSFPSKDDEDPPQFFCTRGPEPGPEDTMMLKGIEVDTIHSVTAPLFRVLEDVDDPTFFLQWEEFAILQMPPGVECPYGGTFEGRLDAFWRTICTDRIYASRSHLRVAPSCRELFEQWRAKLVRNANPVDAYVPETMDSIDPTDRGAQARVMYNTFARLSLQRQREAQPRDDVLHQAYEDWKDHVAHLEPNVPSTSSTDVQNEFTLSKFERSIRAWCFARKLARTKSGHLALVDEHAVPGDKVYVLFGGSVPYIVRPISGRSVVCGMTVDESGSHGPVGAEYLLAYQLHQFVGEAYVHGIMDGEAMEYPPMQRAKRRRKVEQTLEHGHLLRGYDTDTITIYKDVLDPLTEEQESLVAAWKDRLKDREEEVWFDHTTPEMLKERYYQPF